MPTTRDNGHRLNFLLMGAFVGVLGGILMALFVMLATGTYLQMGLFTPLYAIAAPLTGPQALITSLLRGSFYLAFGPALLGMVIHLLWAALWGVVFGLLARRLHLTGGLAIISGLVYGVLVMLVMSFIVVPIVGAPNLLQGVGTFLFIIAHALFYGLPLGL
ncbi:MAG TPA: hypothetical protein VFK47_13840, partial [Ktedonobacteraceae bacterium]|nr:hypothetical protein [Ktedonobacteraceae bacterium]